MSFSPLQFAVYLGIAVIMFLFCLLPDTFCTVGVFSGFRYVINVYAKTSWKNDHHRTKAGRRISLH